MALGAIKRNRKKVAAAKLRENRLVPNLPPKGGPRARRVPFLATVRRSAGHGNKHNYSAMACPNNAINTGSLRAAGARSRREARNPRCGYGDGRTPTAAIKQALHRMATKLK